MSVFDGQADLLAELVAASSTWQTLTSTASVSAAKAFVKIPAAFDETQGSDTALTYPRAVIADGGIISRKKVSVGQFVGSGALFLGFELQIPSANQGTLQARRDYFLGKVSAIMAEVETTSLSRATPGGYSTSHLQILEINRVNGPGEYEVDEEEEFSTYTPVWAMEFEIVY